MTFRQVGKLLALTLLLAGASTLAPAENPSVPSHTPDLLGIYPGMPMRAARAQLQKVSSTINVQSNSAPETGFSITIPDSAKREQIEVFLTAAPSDPAVWLITRTQNFGRDNQMSQSALISALREKYGKETMTNDRAGGGLSLYWIFDPSGKLLTSADEGLTGCRASTYVNYVRNGPPQSANSIEQDCFRSFFAVTAMLNRQDAQLLQAYTVELVNLPYAMKAATLTANANNAAAEKARQDQIKKANENRPVF